MSFRKEQGKTGRNFLPARDDRQWTKRKEDTKLIVLRAAQWQDVVDGIMVNDEVNLAECARRREDDAAVLRGS